MSMTNEQMEQMLQALMQQNAMLMEQMKAMQSSSVAPKAEAPTKEAPKVWEDRSLADKIETENKRAEAAAKRYADSLKVKLVDASKGLVFIARNFGEYKDKPYDNILVKTPDFVDASKPINDKLVELGFKAGAWSGCLNAYVFKAKYTDELWSAVLEIAKAVKHGEKSDPKPVKEEEPIEVAEPIVEEEDNDVEVVEVEPVIAEPTPKAKASKPKTERNKIDRDAVAEMLAGLGLK